MPRRRDRREPEDEPEGQPAHPSEGDYEADLIEEEQRFRRWFVCPVVGCDQIMEADARVREPHICTSDQHPSTRMKILFGGRLLNHY